MKQAMNARARWLLLLLVSVDLGAAISCAKGQGETVGRSSYLQSYRTPIVGTVPPNNPSIYNDEFSAQKPTSDDPAYVTLDPKWTEWDFGDCLHQAEINPRMGMLQMLQTGNKEWAGVRESLPVPTLDNPTVLYAVFARMFNNSFGTWDDFAEYFFGMMFCEDATDSASQLYGINTSLVRANSVIFGGTEVMLWPSFDALVPSPDAEMSVGWPTEYWRAIVQSSYDGDDYVTSLQLSASVNGLGYAQLHRYTALDFPFRHLIFGQRSELDVQMGAQVDYVRLFTDVYDIDTTGRVQQLGSV